MEIEQEDLPTKLWIEKQLVKLKVRGYAEPSKPDYKWQVDSYNADLNNEYTLDPNDSYNIWIDGYGMIDQRIPNTLKRLITTKYDRLVYFPFPKLGEPKKTYEMVGTDGYIKYVSVWTELIKSITGTTTPTGTTSLTVSLVNPLVVTYMIIDGNVWKKPVPICIANSIPFKTDDGSMIFHKKSKKLLHWQTTNFHTIPEMNLEYMLQNYNEVEAIKHGFDDHFATNKTVMSQINSNNNYYRYGDALDGFLVNSKKNNFGLLDLLKKEKADAVKAFDEAIALEAKQANMSLAEYVEILQHPQKIRKEKMDALKQAEFASKEMQYMPELLLTISSLRDEIEATHEFFNNQDNKMSFKNIESRLQRLKDMSRILKSIRKDNK